MTIPTDIASRIWARDASLWLPAGDGDAAAAIAGRLGWLDCVDWMLADSRADELQAWAGETITGGAFDRAIVLGMGGSSLAAAVFAQAFESQAGAPALPLTVIDTTRPADITRLAGGDLRRTLIIVASKSGDTVETADLHAFFRARVKAQLKSARVDRHFVFITDRDSKLHRAAGRARVFVNPSDIGGRFSALSYFGLSPAALAGVDLRRLLARAQEFAATTRIDDARANEALALGMRLGRGALAGRDKLLLRVAPRWRAFGLWIEQLIAESTGKAGRGIVPVLAAAGDVDPGEPEGAGCMRARIVDLDARAADRADDAGGGEAFDIDLRLRLAGGEQLGAEFFRWEFATAVAAAYLRVNPFDQPDVEAVKTRTAADLRAGAAAPTAAAPTSRIATECYDLQLPTALETAAGVAKPAHADLAIAAFAAGLAPNSYLALLAYLADDAATAAALRALRAGIAKHARIAATAGFGPRYLHSTGQLHKGGPAGARFIQLIDYTRSGPGTDSWAAADLTVPGRGYTFGRLYRAQADADFAALAAAGRAVLRVELKLNRGDALAAFAAEFLTAVKRARTVTHP